MPHEGAPLTPPERRTLSVTAPPRADRVFAADPYSRSPALMLDRPVPPRTTPSVPLVIAEASIAIVVLLAEVICPCALTEIVGTEEAVPYEVAVTPVFVIEKTVPVSVRPVPAV